MKESDIQSAILDWLRWNGFVAWKTYLGGIRSRGRGGGGWAKNPMKGFPDIGAVKGGRFFALEVKTPAGSMSPEQLEWKTRLEDKGVIYVIATSVDVARDALSDFEAGPRLQSEGPPLPRITTTAQRRF